ncbi:MAG: HipA domain-containing protein [Bdellovibrionales bacterium]
MILACTGMVVRLVSDPKYENLFVCRESDGAPQFLVNLHPDNAVFDIIGHGKQSIFISSGLRYLTNLSIYSDINDMIEGPPLRVHPDLLYGEIADFRKDHEFVGNLEMTKGIETIHAGSLTEQVSEYWQNKCQSRFSGAEIKLPARLGLDGLLTVPNGPAEFTHFIKFPTESGQEGWAVNEWMCLELSRSIGLETADTALLKFNESLPPALIVERFDIPKYDTMERTQLLLQDFCTLAGIDSHDPTGGKAIRGTGTMEDVGATLKQISTDFEADAVSLFKRTALSWAVGDSDMHRKNFSMLFEYEKGEEGFKSGRMSPTYDVTSEIWTDERNGEHTMCIQFGGKRKNFKEDTFMKLADSLSIERPVAQTLLKETLETLAQESVNIARNLPPIAENSEAGKFNAHRIATIVCHNVKRMGFEIPDWEPVRIPKGQRGKSLAKTLDSGSYDASKLYSLPCNIG